MGRPVVHFEIGCRNLLKTQEFYSRMFDWKPQSMGPAAMIAAETGGIGGHIYLKKAESLGGKTLVPPVKIPTGTFAWMQDPEGNTVGLWKSGS